MAAPEHTVRRTITVPYTKQIKNGLVLIVAGRHSGSGNGLYSVVLMTNYLDKPCATVIGNYSYGGLSMKIANVEYKNNAFTLLLDVSGDVVEPYKVAFLQLDLDGTSSGGGN